jgi:hypothetical protein
MLDYWWYETGGVSAPYDKDVHRYMAIGSEKVWNVNPLAETGSDNVDFMAKQSAPLSDEALEANLSQFLGTPVRPVTYDALDPYRSGDHLRARHDGQQAVQRYRATAQADRERLAAQMAADREIRARNIQTLPAADQAAALLELDRTHPVPAARVPGARQLVGGEALAPARRRHNDIVLDNETRFRSSGYDLYEGEATKRGKTTEDPYALQVYDHGKFLSLSADPDPLDHEPIEDSRNHNQIHGLALDGLLNLSNILQQMIPRMKCMTSS